MTRLDSLINVYEDGDGVGVSVPAAYALDAQQFFQGYGLTLSEPAGDVTPSGETVVRLQTMGGGDPVETRLQALHNLAKKYREYVQREP